MRVFLTVPDDDAERLARALEAYNLAHPREPASYQDLLRDALKIYLDGLEPKDKPQHRRNVK